MSRSCSRIPWSGRPIDRLVVALAAPPSSPSSSRRVAVADLRREVQIEQPSKVARCCGRLHDGRGERRPQLSRSTMSTLADRAHRVDGLGRAHRAARAAQRGRRTSTVRSSRLIDSFELLLMARFWSLACLSTTPRVRCDGVLVEGVEAEREQRVRPVDASPRWTAPSSAPSRAAPARCARAARRAPRRPRHPRQDDRLLALGVGVVEVQVEAAALERLGQLAAGVGGEHDERPPGRDDRAELGDRHLEVARAPRAAGPRPRRRPCRSRR